MSSVKLKDVSDVFPHGNVWSVITYTYNEKDLMFKFKGVVPRIEHKEELLDLLTDILSDDDVDKVVVKAEGKFFKDMNKSITVYTKIKGDFKMLPKVGESIRYKDCDECDSEKHQVIAIDSEHENLVIKHVYHSFGERVMYYGIPFSEYFDQMGVVE